MSYDIPDIPDDFDPFVFECDICGKTHLFTEEEIEEKKTKIPGTDDDYWILCQFCKKGHMQPPQLVMKFDSFDGYS